MKKSVDQSFDELYRSTFENGNVAFDKESIWPEIEAQLPGRERRFLYWMNLLVGSLLVAYFVISLTSGGHVAEAKAQANLKGQGIEPKQQAQLNLAPIIAREDASESRNSSHKPPSILDEKQSPVVDKTMGSNTNINSSSLVNLFESELESKDKATSPLIHDFSKNVKMYGSQKSITGLLLPSISNFDKKQLPQRPDPNKWSQCSIKDQPHIFSDIYTFAGRPFINNQENPAPSNDHAGFLEQWNEGESPVSTYGFGMMVGIGAYWGGTFSAGLEYQQIQNKINRSQTVIERITVYDEMAYYYLDSNNNRVWVADSVTSTRIYSRELQASKTHTLVNLPLLLGYHLEKGNWRAGISAGINIHLLHSFSGKVLDPSGQIIEADTGSPRAVYNKDLGFSIIGGFDLGYYITLQTELYVSPRFRYNPKSWLNPGHPLESRIQMVGLQAGARWHF